MKRKIPFKILPHTADVRLQIFGETPQEVFQNALLGIREVLKPIISQEKSQRRRIEIESLDASALLVDFLSEILYLVQTEKEIYEKIELEKLTERELKGWIEGKKIESFGEDIKGVTYHEAYFQKKDGKWEAMVIFDI